MAFSYDAQKRYKGKRISVLGDSISTLEGHNPENCKVFYTKEKCALVGIKEARDTWWGMLAENIGCEILVNNSVSGSRVTKLPDREELYPSGCCDERTSGLHTQEAVPDIIVVYLGTNDWYNGVSLEHKYGIQRLLDQSFGYAYNNMLSKLKSNYPLSEIWCCTLCPSDVKNSDGEFPFEKDGVHMKAYCDLIKAIAEEKGCKVLDLFSRNVFYSTIDGYHPDVYGMKEICSLMLEEINGQEIL